MVKAHFSQIIIWVLILTGLVLVAMHVVPVKEKRLSTYYHDATMPPPKSERHRKLEILMKERGLIDQEMDELKNEVSKRNDLWDSQPMISEVLKGVTMNKEKYLRNKLMTGNLSSEEVEKFITFLKTDVPILLEEN
jgi:hypothetical protein